MKVGTFSKLIVAMLNEAPRAERKKYAFDYGEGITFPDGAAWEIVIGIDHNSKAVTMRHLPADSGPRTSDS